jgi:murein DD-endopeptidase MepM/ murein hydrolase activator NlpD
MFRPQIALFTIALALSQMQPLHAVDPNTICLKADPIPLRSYDHDVKIETRGKKPPYEIIAYNKEKIPVYVTVTMKALTNMESENGTIFTVKLEPEKQVTINSIKAINPAKRYRYNYSYQFNLVDLATLRPDTEPTVQLPFPKGVSSKIIQGYHGKFSHFKEHSAHAIDFKLARGAKVLAARGGLVVMSRNDATFGGYTEHLKTSPDGAGNFVYVLHDDGTVGVYAHLQCGGTSLRRGDTIKAGDLIGYAGSTGYAHPNSPHLHFVIRAPVEKYSYGKHSVPARFETSDGVVTLKEGATYSRP